MDLQQKIPNTDLGANTDQNPQVSARKQQAIQSCVGILEHACQCRGTDCHCSKCKRMKRILSHAKTCKRRGNGSCAICKQFIALNCYHAKNCQETKCPVPFCFNIKYKQAANGTSSDPVTTMQNSDVTETGQ